MPKGARDELLNFLSNSITRPCLRKTITEAEYEQIHLGFSRDISLPFRAAARRLGRGAPALAKQPDAFLGLQDHTQDLFPRVIFQVGFSHSYAKIPDDTKQLLVRSTGGVPLVVLTFIDEHPIPGSPNSDDDDQYSDVVGSSYPVAGFRIISKITREMSSQSVIAYLN